MALFEPIFEALERAGARYVVVGGFATVLHGVARLTADVDLIVDLEPAEAEKVIVALTGLGFRPRPPVEARQFADPAIRTSWVRDKGMRVFSLWDPANPMREVDLFVEHPLDFERLWRNAERFDLGAVGVRVASLEDLVALKRLAGRPQDVADVAELEAIAAARGRIRG